MAKVSKESKDFVLNHLYPAGFNDNTIAVKKVRKK